MPPSVAYFYDEEIGNYCYGGDCADMPMRGDRPGLRFTCFPLLDAGGNPMRPHRARLAYSLVNGYGLSNQMVVFRPQPRSLDQLTEFHADEYIQFLKQ